MSSSFSLGEKPIELDLNNVQGRTTTPETAEQPLTTSSTFLRHAAGAEEDNVEEEEEEEEAKMEFLKQLEQSVASAKEEVLRTRELLTRAVWYNVLEARPKNEKGNANIWAKLPPRAPVKDSVPLSVTERRAQLQEQSSLKLLQQRQFDRHEDDDTGLRGVTNHSQVVTEKPPFIPPNRFPTMPPLSSSDYAHFNYTLYQSVLSAHSQGLLSKKRATKKSAGNAPPPPPPPPPSHTSRSALRRDAMRNAITTHQKASASTTRIERPQEKTFSCLSKKEPIPAPFPQPGSEEEGDDGLPCQSVSVIILRIALKRANATLFLRQLRLSTFQRRLFLEEIALREKFYIQRRYMMEWRWRMYVAQRRRQALLEFCVQAWCAAVAARHRIHAVCAAYRSGLLERRAARLCCEEKRRGRLFRHWVKVFLHKRFMRTLYDTADAFYKGVKEKRNHYVDVFAQPQLVLTGGAPRGSSASAPPISTRLAARHALDHWRARYTAREVLHTAEHRFRQHAARHVLRTFVVQLRKRLTAQLSAPGVANGPRIIILPSPQSKEHEQQPTSDMDQVVLSRQFHIHVDGGYEALLSYKNACARRVAQGALLQDCFLRWRSRANTRRARHHWQMRMTTQCMRHWLYRLSLKYQQQEAVENVFRQWKERWVHRRHMRAATYFYFLKVSSSVWDQWRAVQAAKQQYKKRLLTDCLRRWYFRAAGAVSLRIAEEKQKQCVFAHWKQRFTCRRSMSETLLVADTIRETIVLIGCMRAWQQRFSARRRCALQASVLTELRDEQRCRYCFERWKKKAFGPRPGKLDRLEALTF